MSLCKDQCYSKQTGSPEIWCEGEILTRDRRLTSIFEENIKAPVRLWSDGDLLMMFVRQQARPTETCLLLAFCTCADWYPVRTWCFCAADWRLITDKLSKTYSGTLYMFYLYAYIFYTCKRIYYILKGNGYEDFLFE